MRHRTLIAYASRAGATADVAGAIGDVLRICGIDADVRPIKDVRSFEGYDSLVAGSAIWVGKPLPEMLRFLQQHRDCLARVPVAYFILCDTLRTYTPSNRQIALGYAVPLREIKEPIELGMFAGRRDFSRMNPLVRWLLMRVIGLEEGDWRDWDQIRAWASRTAEHILREEAREDAGQVTPGAA
jgi:menaquinone-dependent protoporphyrinogen oxidase